MNFFDYEIARNATSTPPVGNDASTGLTDGQPEMSLNEEVSQVVGQLGRLWGGFRKQSQMAFESARKEVGTVVAQAQKELVKLTTEETDGVTTSQSSSEVTVTESGETVQLPKVQSELKEKSDNTVTEESATSMTTSSQIIPETPPDSVISSSTSTTQFPSFQGLFSRVQAAIPPNISTTLQNNLPESIREGHINVDFNQLKNTIATEFQRVQGVTRAQAEGYVHKSEVLLKEAGEFLKDAVKVIPPEEAGEASTSGTIWDGSDIWVMPTGGRPSTRSKGKGKAKEVNSADQQQQAIRTRADALLQQLRRDPQMVKQDPAAVEATKDLYEMWRKSEVDSKEGGINGSIWCAKIEEALDESNGGEYLKSTKETLVPSVIDEPTFWTRYFFRVYQIDKEEERRKELLEAGTAEAEEDFSWEDDEDESITPNQSENPVTYDLGGTREEPHIQKSQLTALQAEGKTPATSYPSSLVTSPSMSNVSPRLSSEGSYDMVSNGNGSGAPDTKKSEKVEEATAEEDEDSDWE